MKRKYTATATAILGLAFGASAATAADSAPTASDTAFAVDGLGAAPGAAPSNGDEGTANASGVAFIDSSLSTGNVNTVSAAGTVLNACTSGDNIGTQFQTDCTALVVSSPSDEEGVAGALTALTPDQVLAQNNVAAQQVKAGLDMVAARMAGARIASGADGFSPSAVIASGLLYSRTAGGAAGGDLQAGPFGAFFNVKYGNGSQDRDEYSAGYDADGWTATLGADYRVRDNLILGALATFGNGTVDYDEAKGNMDLNQWGIGAYGTHYWDGGTFVEGVVGYNANDYDLKRNIRYSVADADGTVTSVNQVAKSSPDADVFYASFGVGYDMNRQSLTFTPKLSLNYSQNSVNSYAESMSDPTGPGGGFAVSYGSETYESFTSRLGATLATAVSTEVGVFVPQFSVDWIHEFRNDQKTLGARFVSDLSFTPLLITTTEPDRNFFDVGVGVSGQFAEGKSGFISFNTILGYDDVDWYTITGGVRMEF